MSSIRKVKRKNLDLEKYSRALNDSLNYRIYAEDWYLDILTNGKWECLVYGDYEVIMPIPLQFKFGMKFVLQPVYCQQLGLFYKEEITEELFREFEKKLHNYRVRSYCFNEENTEIYNLQGEKRVNYILDLSKPYEEIFKKYKKKRRKDLNKGSGIQLVENNTAENHFKIQREFYKNLTNFTQNKNYISLLSELTTQKKLKIYDLYNDNELVASQMFIYSKDRIICSSFFRNKELDFYNCSAYSKNYLIQKESNKRLFLDFEGSMIAGVAEFYEGFGSTKKYYTKYKNVSF